MKHALVTGGAGFIGSFLVDELVRRGYAVRVFDNLDPQVHPNGKPPEYLNRDADFMRGDMLDVGSLHKALDGIEIVCHLAGVVGVGQSQYEIARYVSTNIQGTANLLDVLANSRVGAHGMRPINIEKLLIASSMSSYGEGAYRCAEHGDVRPPLRSDEQMSGGDWELRCPKCDKHLQPLPVREEAARNVNSIYALTKMVQEDMCMMMGRVYKIPTVALRYFNVYGPRQSLSNPYTGVAAIFMSRIKNGNPPVVYEDGAQTRDFVSIHDIVRANMLALTKPEADYGIFNVGCGVPRNIADIARAIAKALGSDIEPQITNKFRKGDVRHCYADITRIRETLGFEPKVSFDEGMIELADWARGAKSDDLFDRARRELEEKGIA